MPLSVSTPCGWSFYVVSLDDCSRPAYIRRSAVCALPHAADLKAPVCWQQRSEPRPGPWRSRLRFSKASFYGVPRISWAASEDGSHLQHPCCESQLVSRREGLRWSQRRSLSPSTRASAWLVSNQEEGCQGQLEGGRGASASVHTLPSAVCGSEC